MRRIAHNARRKKMFSVSVLDVKTAAVILKEIVSEVILPGAEGELCILDFHQPIISYLKGGTIRMTGAGYPIRIKKGIARMEGNELVVLVEK